LPHAHGWVFPDRSRIHPVIDSKWRFLLLDRLDTCQEVGMALESEKTQLRLAEKLDAIGWGAFFIWVGYAFLVDVGIGVGLLGVGVIILAGQIARRLYSLPLEGFWVLAGLLFALGGMWELYQVRIDLVPVLLIVIGLVVIGFGLSGKRLGGEKPFCSSARGEE
jgi:hypothetical protein